MKGNLVLNEKLVESFLNEDKHSYKIPKNWIWVHLGKICDVNMGQSPKGEYTTDEPNNVPLVGGPADMGDLYPNSHRYTVKPTKLSEKGELIVSVRATLGKTNFADRRYCLGRGVAGIRSKIIDVRLLKYFFDVIKPYLYSVSTGTTFQQVSKKDIEGISIPLPPQNEQIRIVDKIEQLLSKIDEAKRLIEEAKETFELRRAAVLDKAFRGKLGTNNPSEKSLEGGNSERNLPIEEQPYEIPQNWLWVSLNAIAKFINGDRGKNYPSQKDFVHEGIPFINAGHLVNGKIKMSDMNYISEEKFNSLGSGKVCNNDILYCLRGTLGKTAIVEGIEKGAIASSLVILRPYQNVNNEFLYYYLISTLGQSMIKIHDNGSAQPNLSASNVKKYIFPLPPLAEQKRIVEKLNHVIGNMENEQFAIDKALEELEQLKNVILSKAFRGELGTNDPTEESAIELLKEVLQEQVK